MKNKIITFVIIFKIIFLFSIIAKSQELTSIYEITAKKVFYLENENLIIAEGDAQATDQFGKKIYADKINYNKKKGLIFTEFNSKYIDNKGNVILAENFYYDLNLKKIEAKKNVVYTDANKNIFEFSNFEYFENSEKGTGENMFAHLASNTYLEGEIANINNLTGIILVKNSAEPKNIFDKLFSIFKKKNNHYTNCINTSLTNKNINERCPDWSVTTTKSKHDQKTKTVHHENAIIKIRNIPVFYTPYFSHPDPSVKRKSGILTPSTKTFHYLGQTIKSPYFWAIDENSDLTITPILYLEENSILLTEYRKQDINSNFYIDTSFSKGYKNLDKKDDDGNSLNRTGGSRNHFFLNYNGIFENLIYEKNEINLSIQRVSQKNYLNVNQINTQNINQDINSLTNTISIDSYGLKKKLGIRAQVFENLSDDNGNTKYQYTIPAIDYSNFFTTFNNNFNLTSSFASKYYSGDTKETSQINQIQTISEPYIMKNLGVSNSLLTKISNINVYNDKVDNAKDNFNSDIITTLALESSFPLGKFGKKTEEIIMPKIFLKHTPGNMSDENISEKIIGYGDLYSMDRLNSLTNPERGTSLGYGTSYEINKKNSYNEIYTKSIFEIGQIINSKKNSNMPTNSSLNEKNSNFVGNFSFYFNKALELENEKITEQYKQMKKTGGFNLNYSFNINNDFNKLLKNQISMAYSNRENSLKLDYYELNEIGNEQNIEVSYSHNFDNNLNLYLKTRKNLELNYTESNSIEFNYESDCIKIGATLSKVFYESEDVQKDNNLMLTIMLKPFGQPFSPDLTKYIENKK